MKFAEIPFHQDIKTRLRQMVDDNHLPHALLLEGPSGSAKFMLARALAQYIHCTNRTSDGDSCGECPSCLQHENFNNIDVFYSFPVLKKNGKQTVSDDYYPEFKELLHEAPYMDFGLWLSKLGNQNGQPAIYVEEISKLLERLNLTARQSRYKIVILWLPERLREEAANKLLKLLEEPHHDTLFILSSDNPARILPTIYSRTQRINVRRYSDDEVADILQNKYGTAADRAQVIAALTEGNVTTAINSISDEKEGNLFLDLFIKLMRNAWTRKVSALRSWSNEVAALGREGSIRFYDYCIRMLRENFIMNLGEEQLNVLSKAETDFSVKFSPFINSANINDLFRILSDAKTDTSLNGNGKIIAFDLAVKTILLIKRAQDTKA